MIPKQRKLLIPNLNRTSTELRDQNSIPRLNADLQPFTISVESTGSDGEDFSFGEFFDGRLWEEDSRGGFCFGADALDEDSVEEGGEGFDCSEGGGLYFIIGVLEVCFIMYSTMVI